MVRLFIKNKQQQKKRKESDDDSDLEEQQQSPKRAYIRSTDQVWQPLTELKEKSRTSGKTSQYIKIENRK